MRATIEDKIEEIRGKWAKPKYRLGAQASCNYIPCDDALKIVDLIEAGSIELRGFEAFRWSSGGRVEPSSEMSMEYFRGAIPIDVSTYDHARKMLTDQRGFPHDLRYQIFYDGGAARLA